MPETPVVGQSSISFNVSGSHLMIPLSALYFDDKGKLKADHWPLYGANSAAVDTLLARQMKEGVLRAGTKPTAKPSFTATAVSPGAGVGIDIEISNVAPDAGTPANSKADFKITEKETYTGIELAKLKDRVGTAANGGTTPGLVFVSAGTPDMPTAGVYPMAGNPATVKIPKNGGGGDAFELTSRGGGADAALTSVEIKDVNVPAAKFTLVATWTKSSAALAMTGLAAAFAYSLAITAPAGGLLAPVAGKISLSGGADAVSVNPIKSSVTVPAQ
jgi:hypothetical protein